MNLNEILIVVNNEKMPTYSLSLNTDEAVVQYQISNIL